MKLQELFDLAVTMGKESDPRGLEGVNKLLLKNKENYDDLKDADKKEYDMDRLTNPFDDTRILYGNPEKEIKRVIMGVDMEVGELLLADRLTEKGQTIDLVIAHHPEGKALAALHAVMHMQADILNKYGVPINVAEGIMSSRISEVKRGIMPINHNRAVDTAKLLDIPMACIHTPTDNLVVKHLQTIFDTEKPETLDDVVKLLKQEPEYAEAVQYNAGPAIVVGDKKRRAGKVMVDMTGGTGGSKEAFEKLAIAGVGTLVVMHIGEEHRKNAEKHNLNVIIAGHLASDSLGINILIDEFEKKGVEVLVTSGLIRHKRS
ncbi:MAG: Nif3-like dinuclear metal center hexameric protein [Clostridiales bacterium]|nr:Nif3-like dinuclear metal center hexameric protein [Clostridiales bacterium]